MSTIRRKREGKGRTDVDGLVKLLAVLLEARVVRLDRLGESREVGFDEEL
jgi:hypothetical protein